MLTLESAVKAIAPQGMDEWADTRDFDPVSEPTSLVDALLDTLSWTSEERAAVGRQAACEAASRRPIW